MGYTSAHVIIGDQSEKRFLTLSETSPYHHRASRWIGDGTPSHRRYYHIEYASPVFTRAWPMCRRCVTDVFGTFLTFVYIAESSPTARRCSAVCRRWYLTSKHLEKISMHAFKFFSMSRCLGEAWRLLAYVADHSPNHWWRCPGDAQICASREHREA